MELIRSLRAHDLRALLDLSGPAGWNQTEADWRRLLELEPEGCFGLECDGLLVATATAICYGSELAWVGMVLTHPDYRGRGFGSRLTKRAIEHARQRRVASTKLDATDMGRPVYLRLGFTDECPMERWSTVVAARPSHPEVEPSAPAPFTHDPETDRLAFGANRALLLAELARNEAASAAGGAYIMARPGIRAVQIGPCIARSAAVARELLSWVVARHPGQTLYWDLFPGNTAAVRIAADLGFAPVRRLTRMALRGPGSVAAPRHDDSLVFAIAGFEYG